MRIELSSPFRKGAFVIGCAAVLSLASALCCQELAHQWFLKSGTVVSLRRAARVQPLDAEAQERLGILAMDASYGDFRAAAWHFQRAVAINPHSSRGWLNLANAYAVLGDDARRGDAVQHALLSEPKDTQVQWEAANLYLGTDLDRSLKLLRGVVENDSQYAPAAAEIAYRACNGDIEKAMLAIPQVTSSRLQLMHWLLERNQAEATDRVWPTVITAPGSLKAQDTFFFIDSLIARHKPGEAFAAWSAMRQKDPALRVRHQPENLASNGDFESDLLNGGFGWRFIPVAGVTASLDTSSFHSGTRSLFLQIDGVNVQEFGISQLVCVRPAEHYTVAAWFHGEELEAAHGARLAVIDAYSQAPLAMSDELLGSFPWREVDADFTVPPGTQLVRLAIIRSPGDGVMKGRLWFDDVRVDKQ